MRTLKIFCDICGKESKSKESWQVNIVNNKITEVFDDCCEDCMKKIKNYINKLKAGEQE